MIAEVKMSEDDNGGLWAHCNACSRKTRHDVKGEFIQEAGGKAVLSADDRWALSNLHDHRQIHDFMLERCEPHFRLTYQIIQCRGCDETGFRKHTWCDEWLPDYDVQQYPPPVSRPRPRWMEKLGESDEAVAELLEEIFSALQADNRRLATMGARCVLDCLISKKVGEGRSFREGLELLVQNHNMTPEERTVLEAGLDAGHAAAHRNYRPNVEDLGRVMNIVEHLTERFLVLPGEAEELNKTTPPKPSRPPTPRKGNGKRAGRRLKHKGPMEPKGGLRPISNRRFPEGKKFEASGQIIRLP